jgi:hypothetical protein
LRVSTCSKRAARAAWSCLPRWPKGRSTCFTAWRFVCGLHAARAKNSNWKTRGGAGSDDCAAGCAGSAVMLGRCRDSDRPAWPSRSIEFGQLHRLRKLRISRTRSCCVERAIRCMRSSCTGLVSIAVPAHQSMSTRWSIGRAPTTAYLSYAASLALGRPIRVEVLLTGPGSRRVDWAAQITKEIRFRYSSA